jgi:hypothetical protein
MNTAQATAETRPFNPEKPFIACDPSALSLFEEARVRMVFSVDVPVTAVRLFEVFEDPASWPRWAHGIGKVQWTSPKPFQVGTTRTVTFWGGMEVYEDFVAWAHPREMAFVLYGATQEVWSRFGEHYRVVDKGDGSCTLTWTVAYDPTGVFARIHFLVGWLMKLNLNSYMWRLRRYCRRLGAS